METTVDEKQTNSETLSLSPGTGVAASDSNEWDRLADKVEAAPEVSIAGYSLVREIHRGGQGVIYEAIQLSTKRKVAIKVLLEGPFASKSAKRRFEREIELVGALRHPNIISIFDSGVTQEGLQYCVMDYVRGVPLDRYVRERKLSLEQAVELFILVCDAVNYAHQKGVIHRDLKPSNVIVNNDGAPEVLDFGLAKTMMASSDTLVSITGHVVGTLQYLAPEQARGHPDEVDTRTDVYSLGVILFQLLTGEFPYTVTGPIHEVLRTIPETEPVTPTRAWKINAGITHRQNRRVRAGGCPIDPDVETVIMKALSKERDRRYQSAGELARDLRHYLAGQPIEARRDSSWYIIKKTLARNKVLVTVGTIFMLTGFGSGVVMSVMYDRLKHETRTAMEMYRKVFQASSDAVMIFDADTFQFIDANDATLDLYGYTRPEFLTITALDISNEPDKTREAVGKIRNGEWVKIARRIFLKQDGTTFPGEVQAGKFVHEGRVVIVGNVRDLTATDRGSVPAEPASP